MQARFNTYPLPETPGAYGYRIEGAGFQVIQDYTPGAQGIVPMSEAEATAYAQAAVASLTAATTPQDPAEPMPDPAPTA
jgi:hypothetical protein